MSILLALLLSFGVQAEEPQIDMVLDERGLTVTIPDPSHLHSRCSDAVQEVDCETQDQDVLASDPVMISDEWGFDGETLRRFTPEERLTMKKAELEEALVYVDLLRGEIAALEAQVASEEE